MILTLKLKNWLQQIKQNLSLQKQHENLRWIPFYNCHLRQGPICDLDKGTYIIINTCRIIKQMCLRKTLNVIFLKWRTIRASTTSNLHIWTISLGNSLCSHGNPTQLTNMLMNKTKEMASQYEWHSYCSSIWKYDNQCFGMHFDFIILHVSTIMEVPLLGLQIGPCLKCICRLKKC